MVCGQNINFPLKIATSMGHPCNWHILSATNTHAAKQRKYLLSLPCFASPIETAVEIVEIELPPATGSDSKDIEVTKWIGQY